MSHEPHRCRTCKSFRYQADGDRVAEWGACVRQMRGGAVRPYDEGCEFWTWCIDAGANGVKDNS